MFLREFLEDCASFPNSEAFLSAYPHPFLLEEGDVFAAGGRRKGRLICYLDPGEGPSLVGRKPPADVKIDDDPAISGRHANFLPPTGPSDRWRLADLSSTNGTFLNGKRIDGVTGPQVVPNRASIGFGPNKSFVFLHAVTFHFLHLGAGKEGSMATLVQKSVSPTESWDRDRVRVSTNAPTERGKQEGSDLYLICEGYPPLRIEPGMKVVVGRSSTDADFVLPDPTVSRQHAELLYQDDVVLVSDLKSANGVVVNGEEVGSEPGRLLVGDEMCIGEFRLKLRKQPHKQGETFSMKRASLSQPVEMDLTELPLEALLTTLEKKLTSGCIKVIGEDCEGEIAFLAGKPTCAETRCGLDGVAAIKRMLELEEGTLFLDPNASDVGEAKIDAPFSAIIQG